MKEKEKCYCYEKGECVVVLKKGVREGEGLKLFNVALLAKWRWNLFHQQDTLLGDILNAKYGG